MVQIATAENRLILTFDADFGELIFRKGYRPPGVIYFRWTDDYKPVDPGIYLERLLVENKIVFEGFLTVIGNDKIRQKPIS